MKISSKYSHLEDGNNPVYSPVPQKYCNKQNKFSMVLRPRQSLKHASWLKGISSFHVPIKSLKAINPIAKVKKVQKQKRLNSNLPMDKGLQGTPFSSYRAQLSRTPLTPDNPFGKTPSSTCRRSKRLFNSGPIEDNRSRDERLLSAIKKLSANTDALAKVLPGDDNEVLDNNSSEAPCSGNSASWKYVPVLDSTSNQSPSKRSTKPRRGKASLKRRLSCRFRKEVSSLQENVRSPTLNTAGASRLRGKYNHALYFDG